MKLLHTGSYEIKGIAWTGKGMITEVEVSLDDGQTWEPCQLTSTTEKYTWIPWSYKWEAQRKGEYIIKSKATDSYGNVQPIKPFWNRKGYGYNAIDKIKVKVE